MPRPRCIEEGCNRRHTRASAYCYIHSGEAHQKFLNRERDRREKIIRLAQITQREFDIEDDEECILRFISWLERKEGFYDGRLHNLLGDWLRERRSDLHQLRNEDGNAGAGSGVGSQPGGIRVEATR